MGFYQGKRLSILGDSISTYEGYSNDASANSTTGRNPAYYEDPFPLEATYWMRVLKDLGMTLCVNNSWSGGLLTGEGDPDSGVERAGYLATDAGELPDVILVFMGINDLGWGIPVRTFAAAYRKTLATLREKYPGARVFCVNLPDRDPAFRSETVAYNEAILDAVRQAGDAFSVADLFHSRLNNWTYIVHTLDGLHPTTRGMELIAETVTAAMTQQRPEDG